MYSKFGAAVTVLSIACEYINIYYDYIKKVAHANMIVNMCYYNILNHSSAITVSSDYEDFEVKHTAAIQSTIVSDETTRTSTPLVLYKNNRR